MASGTYGLVLRAMRERRQVTCVYGGLRRAVCPIVLGTSEGREKVLAFQVGGQSSRPLRGPETRWRCMFLEEMTEVALQDGPWQAGGRHRSSQTCVRGVDYDVNPESPFNPKFRL
jgi:hypothetical protein